MTDTTLALTKHEAIKRHVLGLNHKPQLGPTTKLPIAEIIVGERTIPEDAKVVAQLKISFREVRQTTPIVVRRNSDRGYSLVDGLNRLAALKELGETEVLATLLDVSTEEEAKACEAISNRHRRQGLTALDRALSDVAYVHYVAHKVPQDAAPPGGRQPRERFYAKTARELGVSPDQIARSCKIAKIVPQIQRAIRDFGQEDNQTLLLEVAKSGDDYSAQLFTLTRLMNKVPEAAEQPWTNQLSPPANLGTNGSPHVTVADSSDDGEISSSGGQSAQAGTSTSHTPEAAHGEHKPACGHEASPNQLAPALAGDQKRKPEVVQAEQKVADGEGGRGTVAAAQIELITR
jgi:hypothetical protein